MNFYFGILVIFFSTTVFAAHRKIPGKTIPNSEFYRAMTLRIRNSGEFKVPTPGTNTSVSYNFEFNRPIYKEPVIGDLHFPIGEAYFLRTFFDRILFKDGSFLEVNGEKLPLTCVFVEGQDNRFSKNKPSPLLPEFVLKVYLVANDFSCQGPLKPGWPETGGREQNWDTYLFYQIKDPTIMLPVDAKLRYRWNEYDIVLVDKGSK